MASIGEDTYNKIFREGKAEGIAEGKAEGIAEGKAEGIAEGKAEGILEGIKQVAQKALNDGLPVEQIASFTGLSVEEINKLK